MRAVGVKVLKNKLSEYVRLAASGETVLVTDRDRVVAELARRVPAARPSSPMPARGGRARGLDDARRWSSPRGRRRACPWRPGTSWPRELDADRGDR